MKKFLIQLFLFLLLFTGIDYALGEVLRYGEAHAIGGKTERNYYINHQTHEDILFFGSSRSMNHYVPKVFEDSLGMTAYNCGEDETGIVCFYPKLNLIKQRYTPKVIIYDVYYVDLLDSLRFQNIDFLKTLKTSYGSTAVDSIFNRYEPSSQYKMCSKLFRYNSNFLNILMDNARKTNWFSKGFYLLNTNQMQQEPVVDNSHHKYYYDAEKLSLLEKFIVENKDSIRLYFAISPEYGRTNDEMFQPVKDLCNKYSIPLLNHYCDTMFTRNKELFGNQNHLNQKGATLYSSQLANEIKYEQ